MQVPSQEVSSANVSYSLRAPSKFPFALFSSARPRRPGAFDICNALWFYNLTNPGNGNLLNRFACCFQIVVFFPLAVCVSMNVPEPTRSLSLLLGKQKINQPRRHGDSLILS